MRSFRWVVIAALLVVASAAGTDHVLARHRATQLCEKLSGVTLAEAVDLQATLRALNGVVQVDASTSLGGVTEKAPVNREHLSVVFAGLHFARHTCTVYWRDGKADDARTSPYSPYRVTSEKKTTGIRF